MTVRAKFQRQSIQHHHTYKPEDVCVEIVLVAVWTGENGENIQWSKATPTGRISMTITNPQAVEQFELGKFYYADFSPAPAV